MELRHTGVVEFKDLGLDVATLYQEAQVALEEADPRGTASAIEVHDAKLSSLTPLFTNSQLLKIVTQYLGGATLLHGYMVIRLRKVVDATAYAPGSWHHDQCGRGLKLFIFLHDVS